MRWILVVALGPIAAALWLLFPAWLHWDTAVVGDWVHPDMISNHWLYRWMGEQILSGGSIIHNDRYYYPVGDFPWIAGNGSDAFAWLLLGSWMPWPASMTLWAMLIIVINGISGAVLARVLGARLPGAALGGTLLAMSPYVAYELSCARYAQAPLFWMAFFLATWIRLLEQPSARRGVLAGLLYAVTAFTCWYYGLWAALAGVVLFAMRRRWQALRWFVPTALLVTLPPLVLFLQHWASIPGTTNESFPHPLAVASGMFFTFPVWGGEGPLQSIVLPISLVVLAVIGLWRWPWSWSIRGLVAVAGVFYLLSLGPYLLGVDGEASAIPAPYLGLYAPLGVLRRYWWPYRHIAVLTIALVPLAARGADRLLQPLGRLSVVVIAAVVALLPLEIGARGGTTEVRLSGWTPPAPYQELATLEGDLLLELPLAPTIAASQQSLSYQWIHKKTLINGHAMWVDRVRPEAWDAWIAQSRFLDGLQKAELGELDGSLRVYPEDIAYLQSLGLRHIVLNTEFFPGRLSEVLPVDSHILVALFGSPIIEHGGMFLAWDLSQYNGTTDVAVPSVHLPEEALAQDGTLMPKSSNRRSLGWTPMIRTLAGVMPTAEDAPDDMSDMLHRKILRERKRKREALKDVAPKAPPSPESDP